MQLSTSCLLLHGVKQGCASSKHPEVSVVLNTDAAVILRITDLYAVVIGLQ